MPEPTFLIGLLLSAIRAAPLIKDATKALVAVPEIVKASKATEVDFPMAENLLEVWTKSAHFSGIVKMALEGRRDADDDSMVGSFIASTGFDVGPETREQARQIVEAFLKHIAQAHLSGPNAIPVLAHRIEAQHTETRTMFAELDRNVRQVTARLDSTAP